MSFISYITTQNFSVTYDQNEQLLLVTYQGLLTSQITQSFYQWLIPIMKENPHLVSNTRGSIYDFRLVTEFQTTNMITARRESQSANRDTDMSNHPVALIAENLQQEQAIKLLMQLTEQVERKRIVNSMDEAKAFIRSWYQKV
jgi:hypothetical protein